MDGIAHALHATATFLPYDIETRRECGRDVCVEEVYECWWLVDHVVNASGAWAERAWVCGSW